MKTAIVTGAAGNLGQAIVQKFLEEGFNVIGTTHGNHMLPFSTHKNFEAVVVDLSNETETQKFTGSVITKYGTIDVAVLTVGGFAMNKIVDTPIEDIKKQYKLNFETTYIIARLVFIQMMKQGSGRIFLTGSRTGSEMRFSKGMPAYGLSKSLIFRLAELMNDEAKGTDIVTSVISPSTIDTPENRKAMPDADYSKWVKAEAIATIVYRYCTSEMSVAREPVIKVYNHA
jgi:NAD(P)-dependent dehydrogenase (short-subunit alcohol dehydrogenase family)